MMLVISWKSRTFCWNLIGYFLLALRQPGRALGSHVRLNESKKGNIVACFRMCFSFFLFFSAFMFDEREKENVFHPFRQSLVCLESANVVFYMLQIEPSCTRNFILSILLTANNFTISRFSILWQKGSGATIISVLNITFKHVTYNYMFL